LPLLIWQGGQLPKAQTILGCLDYRRVEPRFGSPVAWKTLVAALTGVGTLTVVGRFNTNAARLPRLE
jgi:hypothetical protein